MPKATSGNPRTADGKTALICGSQQKMAEPQFRQDEELAGEDQAAFFICF